MGRRAQKTIDGGTTAFLYDGLDLVKETDGVGEASYLRTPAIDEALVRVDSVETLHYLADALGGTVALTDSTGGATTTYSYEPFGRTGVEGVAINALQYTGRENDGTGLYYYRARYYDPIRSRFVQEDPLGFVGGGLHLYNYTLNSPIRMVDPLGLLSSPAEIQAARNRNNVLGLFAGIASVGLINVAGLIETGLTAATTTEAAAALKGYLGTTTADLAGATLYPFSSQSSVLMGAAFQGAGVGATIVTTVGAATAAATTSVIVGGFAMGYSLGTWAYGTRYCDAVYAYDYYASMLRRAGGSLPSTGERLQKAGEIRSGAMALGRRK